MALERKAMNFDLVCSTQTAYKASTPTRLKRTSRLGRGGCTSPGSFYVSALLLLQDFAYSCRVWITLIKLLYALLGHLKIDPDIHQGERLCRGLLPSVLRVSEKNSSRKLGE